METPAPSPSTPAPVNPGSRTNPASGAASVAVSTPAPAPAASREEVVPNRIGGQDSEWYIERLVYAPTRTKDKMALLTANEAVKRFREAEGRPPKDLKEVLDQGYGPFNKPADDLEMEYDPKADEVKLYRPVRRQR
jgi:hypothetical protein